MPRAEKRQRKKDNARAAREAREAAERRRKRNRTIITVAVVGVVVIGGFLLINAITGGKSKGKVAADKTTTTTTAPASTTATTTALPAGCVDTVPPKTTKPQNLKAPAMSIDTSKTYTATISTTCGDIKVALDAKNSPKGVNNFVSLAKMGFYDGLTWHRVVKDFVIQGGDPAGDGSGGPGYDVVTELPAGGYKLGDLAWAKTSTAPDGDAGSQFFVVTGDPSALNQKQGNSYQYGYFGKVTSGLDVAQKLESLAPTASGGDGAPTHPEYILKVTISES